MLLFGTEVAELEMHEPSEVGFEHNNRCSVVRISGEHSTTTAIALGSDWNYSLWGKVHRLWRLRAA